MSRRRQSPVMADVARRAGVAPITVSRVINGHPLVTPETRARVQQAIAELGYRSNMAARTLAGGRSRVLGVVSVGTEFYGPSHTLFGIEAAARAAGHMVSFVAVREPTVDALRSALEQLGDAHVEGVIVIAPLHDAVRAVPEVERRVPLVVTTGSSDAASTVSIDQVHGARLATAHLLDLGHRTVHHVRGPRGWIDADRRVDGWRRELRSRRRPVPRALTGDWSPRSGYQAGRVLTADPDVTAVFVANDQMALGLMLALDEAGRRVPDDICVVGFDDTPESAYYGPPLTTVRQDLADVGRRSVALLLAAIGGGDPQSISIEPELVVRASTGPPPRR
jgi:DNA-binding LacI/PurR family transcriptional regulator